jgi:radical SAM-linked protein
MQRLRLKFGRSHELKFISHLDLMRLWERAIRRAGLPLAYSEGFTPHPRISLAAPLSLGVTSEAELMDIYFTRWISPQNMVNAINQQLPQGVKVLEAWPVGLNVASLQSQIRFVEYKVEVEVEEAILDVVSVIKSMLLANEIPWEHERDTGIRHYDLRALIDDVWLIEHTNSACSLGMRLRCDSKGTGRPEQVIKAMGFSQRPNFVHRTKLILS